VTVAVHLNGNDTVILIALPAATRAGSLAPASITAIKKRRIISTQWPPGVQPASPRDRTAASSLRRASVPSHSAHSVGA
jgi:hypothetical protein